ncbi:MAG: Sensor protein ZraS [Phycisphaerae bacterium]|nr:Sensor protein ZraS [Phycisphaerae bacterium]
MPDQELGQVLKDYLNVAERLQRTHEALESEVQRLRRELKRKDRELQRRRQLAALGEMAAGVAHEVRNPLGAIQLYSGLLRHHCERMGAGIELIDKIEAGIQSIERVVQNTLSLAPSRACQLRPQNLQVVIERALDVSADALRRHDVRVTRETAAETFMISCDEEALHRAFVNLLVNAAEASPPQGEVCVVVRRGRRGMVVTEVRDHGRGLQRGAGEKIFNPFYTTKEQGTGLGLTIAYRLIEAHGGRLSARNHPEGGAVFSVCLPLIEGNDGRGRGSQTESRRITAA